MADPSEVHVLVVNQHGDNRGDEAAFRAMFEGIEERAAGRVRFTILHQFSGKRVSVRVPQDVRWISLVPSPMEALRLLLFSVLFWGLRVRWTGLLGPWGRRVEDAYAEADVVVSAPGGPYFGDIYAGHEPAHWFYIWLAHQYGRPLVLYAPSVGPFRKRHRNPFRRCVFRMFDAVSIREAVSLEHLRDLMGGEAAFEPVLVTDSALQRPVPPLEREAYFGSERAHLANRFLVGVSALKWKYPGHPDPAAAHARYEEVVLDSLLHLHERRRAHLLLVPQLYGATHSDAEYLESLGRRLPGEVSWEVVDPDADSDVQQGIFGMADLYFASRYHPQIFGVAGGVPGVCIYYQHKALGFLQELGLEHLAFPIEDLDADRVKAALDHVLENSDRLRRHIRSTVPELRSRSARSSELVAECLARGAGEGAAP